MSASAIVAAAPVLKGLFDLIDELFTSPEEKQNAKLRLIELQQAGQLAQIGVNTQEAKHDSLFVSGWRPFIGWVCGFALVWTFILQPIIVFAILTFGIPFPIAVLPALDLEVLMPLLMGMLGLGAMRSWEKKEGVARNSLNLDRSADGG